MEVQDLIDKLATKSGTVPTEKVEAKTEDKTDPIFSILHQKGKVHSQGFTISKF